MISEENDPQGGSYTPDSSVGRAGDCSILLLIINPPQVAGSNPALEKLP